jgi:hypothetical protein
MNLCSGEVKNEWLQKKWLAKGYVTLLEYCEWVFRVSRTKGVDFLRVKLELNFWVNFGILERPIFKNDKKFSDF